MTSFKPPVAQELLIPGPAGPLEAIVEVPDDAAVTAVAVVCHPHPLHGGTLNNKVVHMLSRTFQERGTATVRFNFRGVGRSAGTHDDGRGETDDALAALDFAHARWPQADLWLAGFSFGGAVAFRASTRRPIKLLVMAAPAVQRLDRAELTPDCPWLIVQGDRDEVITPESVAAWLEGLPVKPKVVMLAGAGHYFHGRLIDLRMTVRAWIAGLV